MAPEGVEEARDGDGDGVRPGEGVVAEQGVEHGQRHHVLGDHLHGRTLRDPRVEGVAKGPEEGGHGARGHGVLRHSGLNLGHVRLGDAAHVLGPAGPVDLAAALLDGLGVDRALEVGHAEVERHAHLAALGTASAPAVGLLGVGRARLAADAEALVLLARLAHGQAVDVGVDALVVASQGL